MSLYRAHIFRDANDWTMNSVRLAVREEREGHNVYLMPDGSWLAVLDGTTVGEPGIRLPAGAVDALADAVAEFRGQQTHADTEARVLREWLVAERERVDAVLRAA